MTQILTCRIIHKLHATIKSVIIVVLFIQLKRLKKQQPKNNQVQLANAIPTSKVNPNENDRNFDKLDN